MSEKGEPVKDILERLFGPGDYGTVPSSWLQEGPEPHRHVWAEMNTYGIPYRECVANQSICRATCSELPEEV